MMIKLIGVSGKICSGKTTVSEVFVNKYGYTKVAIAEPVKEIGKWYIEYTKIKKEYEGNYEKLHAYMFSHNKRLEKRLFSIVGKKGDLIATAVEKTIRAKEMLFEEVFSNFKDPDWSTEKNNDIRLLYQLIGASFRQHFGEDIWINALIRKIEVFQSQGQSLFICDDVRYKSEYVVLKDFGFKVIRLDINEETQKRRVKNLYGNLDPKRLRHSSEIDLDDVRDFDFIASTDDPLEKMLDSIVNYAKS